MILTVEDTNNHFIYSKFCTIWKKTLNRKTHFSLHVIHVWDYFFNYRWTVLTIIGTNVPWPANLLCCKTLGAERFIVRRLGRDAVCVDGLVKLWGKLSTHRRWSFYIDLWAKNKVMTFMTSLESVSNIFLDCIKLSFELFGRLIY